MKFEKLAIRANTVVVNRGVEKVANAALRMRDGLLSRAGLGGRRARYDDRRYEFVGGAGDGLRRRHYDKSLRLLWKSEEHSPWLPFRDCTSGERALMDMAVRSLSEEERAARERLAMPEYRALLDREYSRREKQAIVNVLSAIGHGEAYAWIVSADLLGEVQSTGARAALTTQVLEEAKHFVVLRELLQAFDVPIPRQSAWEYLLLEGVAKSKGLEKFFGMNVVVEGVALGLFGMLSHLPGLEVLRLFHLDESRHTGLPVNYLAEFPLTWWQSNSPLARWRRLRIVLPALGLLPHLEPDLAELGVDAFEFGGSTLRKITALAERSGFLLPVTGDQLVSALEVVFNSYCRATRDDHGYQAFAKAETTRGEQERAIEREIFGVC